MTSLQRQQLESAYGINNAKLEEQSVDQLLSHLDLEGKNDDVVLIVRNALQDIIDFAYEARLKGIARQTLSAVHSALQDDYSHTDTDGQAYGYSDDPGFYLGFDVTDEGVASNFCWKDPDEDDITIPSFAEQKRSALADAIRGANCSTSFNYLDVFVEVDKDFMITVR